MEAFTGISPYNIPFILPKCFLFAFSSYGFPAFFSIKLRKMAKHSIQSSLSHTSMQYIQHTKVNIENKGTFSIT